MPTGYTSTLDNTEKDTADWIVEDLSRAFGMCVMLREDNMGLTADQILAKIKSDSNYHVKALADAKAELLMFEGLSETEWKNIMDIENKDIANSNRESVLEASERAELHERAKRDLKLIIIKTRDDITQNVCKFGLEQLKLVNGECEPYLSELHKDIDVFKTTKLENATISICYHEKELKETEERNNGRV